MSSKMQKVMLQPVSLIFRHLQNKEALKIWLSARNDIYIIGVLLGFDEYMNLVLDESSEVYWKTQEKKYLGIYSMYLNTV